MTAAPFTPPQAAKLAEFDAAPALAETSPIVRAMLALAEELEQAGELPDLSEFDRGVGAHQRDAAARIRTTVAAVLAADAEPREAVIERMARAMAAAEWPKEWRPWEGRAEGSQRKFRRLAAAALDASQGGAQ